MRKRIHLINTHIMTIDFNTMEVTPIPHFKGGEKELKVPDLEFYAAVPEQ